MSEAHPACLPIDALLRQCEVRRQRRSGPGGQHRNKVETMVVLIHSSGAIGEASERRSQEQNRRVAIDRLRVQLALQVRTVPADEPSPQWKARLRGRRVAVSRDHEAFPAILAEALDMLYHCQLQAAAAAERLGCSATQLIRLIQQESQAIQQVNRDRGDAGLNAWK